VTVYNFKRIVAESCPVLLACAMIGLFAGLFLELNVERLGFVALMMVPTINGLGGNIGSILGARISSALHLGAVEPRIRGQAVLRMNVAASAGSSITIFAVASVLFFFLAGAFGATPLEAAKFSASFLMAGVVLTVAVMLMTIAIAFISFRKGLDPDNVVIPVVTSIVDVLGVICLISAIQIIGV